MATDTPPLDEAALPATETGPWSGGADGVCGARCGAGRLTRGGLFGRALPWVPAAGAAGDAVAGEGEGAGRANEGADVAAEAGTAGRNPLSITGACEGSLRLATCSGARAARGATVGSSLWARTAGLNTGGGATDAEGARGTAISGCDGAAAGWGAGSWTSAGGRAPASADGGRMAVELGSLPAGVSGAVAGGVFVVPDVDPLGVGFCFCGFCFVLPRALVVSPVPVPAPAAEVPAVGAGVRNGPGGTVVAVGSGVVPVGSGVVPVGAGVVAGSGGAGAAGSGGAGSACASPATVVAGSSAVSAAFSSAAASSAAEAGMHHASVSMTTTPAHAPRHTMNDAPGPRVVNRHPFALPCDKRATVPCPRPLV
ncbi:MAG: hypothetical protein ACXVSX_03715 [Solirubrobacteraceae bacterium]